jgi:hypothetical protein
MQGEERTTSIIMMIITLKRRSTATRLHSTISQKAFIFTMCIGRSVYRVEVEFSNLIDVRKGPVKLNGYYFHISSFLTPLSLFSLFPFTLYVRL